MTACPAPDAFIELAQCLHERGEYDEAVQAYRRYLQLEPRGLFAADARQYIQTMEALQSSRPAEQAPTPETVQRARQHFTRAREHYNAGRYRQAIDEFRSSYDLVPTREMVYNIGMCYLRLGDHVRALTNFDNVLEGGDTGWAAMAHLQAAECELELERHGRAQTHLQRYLERADQFELPDEEGGRRIAERLRQRIQLIPGGSR
jgi:tetratricopeptide (TPR) repeat protein